MGRSEDEEQSKRREGRGVGREKEKKNMKKEKLEDIYSHGWYVTISY